MTNLTSPDWTELPYDLLQVVSSKLDFIDILGFKRVCSSWLQAAKEQSCTLTPILMIQSATYDIEVDDIDFHTESGKTMRFLSPLDTNRVIYSPQKKKKKNQNLSRLLHKGICIGSSHGWLMVSDKNKNLFLLNPFSGREIELPKLENYMRYPIKNKFILTANPSFTNDYKVVFMFGYTISLCCSRDFAWRYLNLGIFCKYKDMAFSSGKLYAVGPGFNPSWNASKIYTWDLSRYVVCDIINIPSLSNQDQDIMYFNHLYKYHYLVSSIEEIFLIVRTNESNMDIGTVEFKIYKIVDEKFFLMESIPGHAVFIDIPNSCVVMISIREENDEGIKGNSVYFTGDFRSKNNNNHIYHGICVYSFHDKSASLLSEMNDKYHQMPIWVFPGLK